MVAITFDGQEKVQKTATGRTALYPYSLFKTGAETCLPSDCLPTWKTALKHWRRPPGRTKTFYAREAILEHLDDLEDSYLAQQRLTDIRAGKTRTVPIEDVLKRYDMEDRA